MFFWIRHILFWLQLLNWRQKRCQSDINLVCWCRYVLWRQKWFNLQFVLPFSNLFNQYTKISRYLITSHFNIPCDQITTVNPGYYNFSYSIFWLSNTKSFLYIKIDCLFRLLVYFLYWFDRQMRDVTIVAKWFSIAV